jgi:hypothetical protein
VLCARVSLEVASAASILLGRLLPRARRIRTGFTRCA